MRMHHGPTDPAYTWVSKHILGDAQYFNIVQHSYPMPENAPLGQRYYSQSLKLARGMEQRSLQIVKSKISRSS